MQAVSLHRDVILVTSQLFQAHATLLRGPDGAEESFLIDSPVLPEELDLLPALIEQTGFVPPRGLLATHGDWDHLLGPLAFPEATLGCAQSTAQRLRAEPGAAQRALRRFDEELHIERPRPLSLGSLEALAVPGRCDIGDGQLELHPATGHTSDGMAIWIPWARVLVAGDYLSSIELPSIELHRVEPPRTEPPRTEPPRTEPPSDDAGEQMLEAYLATLERLRPLVAAAEHVVPGHGPVLDREAALEVLEADTAYLQGLRELGVDVELPPKRRSKVQRELHEQNVARLRT